MNNRYLQFTQSATLWLIVFACISINLPTTFMSISVALIMTFWTISGKYNIKYNRIIQNPGSIAALILFLLYAVGVLYSSAPLDESLHSLMKYQKLLFIPLVISILTIDKFRIYAVNGFLFCTVFVLAISYLKWLELFPHTDIDQGYSVFRGRIAGSIFMAYGMYLMLYQTKKHTNWLRYAWLFASILASINILFLVNGRTGQVLLIALLAWFTFEVWGLKTIKYWLAIIILGGVLYQNTPNLSESRLTSIGQEIKNHNGTEQYTSAGLRLEFYKNTFTLIKQHPIFGGGTGSLKSEYRPLAIKQNLLMVDVPNPHNQFLLTTQDLGIVGLLTLLTFWLVHWRMSYKLPNHFYGYALRGLIITISIGSLFNSLLFDAGEGKFYCILAGVLLSSYLPNKNSHKNILRNE